MPELNIKTTPDKVLRRNVTMMNSNTDASNDLNWLAFRYVAGEMAADESAAFEQRMLSDLDACEAVIRSAQLCESVDAAFDQPAAPVMSPAKFAQPQETRPAGRRMSVAASAVAGALALALFAVTSRDSVSTHEARETAEIVRLWKDSADTSAGVGDDAEATVAETAQAADIHVPDWMIAALEAKQRDAEEDDIIEN